MKSILFFFVFFNTALQAQNIDVLHYRFFIEVGDKHDTLQGQTVIRLKNVSGKPVQLDLKKKDAGGKGMLVTAVVAVVNGKEKKIAYHQEQETLVINGAELPATDTAEFIVRYKGIPADGLIISKNKFGDRTFFADNWPNRAHHWLPVNDRPNDKASFEFIVTAPAHYNVVSNGTRLVEKEIGSGKKLTHWQEAIPQPTKVMVVGVARFAVKQYADSSLVPVSAWVYPQDSAKGVYDYGMAPSILKFFNDYIGPYPYQKLANVQSTTIFGGMENASAVFYAENTVTGTRSSEALLAHEIAHQWFGDAASEKSFAHLWLSEGFATYMTNLYWEKTHGKAAMIERLKKERQEVIEFARTSSNAVVDSTANFMSLLNANSYQKGGWVLHMLRTEVGDDLFQKIIQAYYREYSGGNADSKDFERIAERISGKELSLFFNQWLYQPGVPQVDVKTFVQKGVLVVSVLQKQANPFRFPLEIMVEGKDGQQQRFKETITAGKQLFQHKVDFAVSRIVVDPAANLLFDNISKK